MRTINDAGETFGAWLLKQQDRGDRVDGLAQAARADRGFPKNGTPDGVRNRLREMQADGDTFGTIDDAEMEWLAYDNRKRVARG